MRPVLYSSTETAFVSNGIGILADAISCVVIEERNGIFELELVYPVDGIHYDGIALRSLILATPNMQDRPQPFRVYDISQPMNGLVTICAQHISYDLNGIPVRPFSAASAPHAMQSIMDNTVVNNPFVLETDKTTEATFAVQLPSSIRSLLGGTSGSLLDVYGGEYHFDRYTVSLKTSRGKDNGVSLRYGKNLTSIQQDKNCENVYTGVYPYWHGSEGAYVELADKIVAAEGSYDFVRIMPLDLSSDWDAAPTQQQLRTRALRYMADNNIGIPRVSITASFVDLTQTEEYKSVAPLEQVALCDTVSVYFPKLGISATAKVVKTIYNVLLDRYDSVEIGEARSSLAETIAGQNTLISQLPQKVIDGLTSTEIFNKLTDYGRIQGIYIQDNKWYINAEVAKVVNLITDHLLSVLGQSSVEITGAQIKLFSDEGLELLISNDSNNVCYIQMFNDSSGMRAANLQITSNTIHLGDLELLGTTYGALSSALYGYKERSYVLARGIGAKQVHTSELNVGDDGYGIYPIDGMMTLQVDNIIPSAAGYLEWIYDSVIGRHVLCLKEGA